MSESRQIGCSELARSLGIHRNTLWLFMHRHGIKRKYSDISDNNLDSLVTEFKRRRPESGVRYIVGFLRKNGIRVQYLRVVHSLRRIDRLGQVLRDRRVRVKRKYHVTRPNALWHIDSHHKLIHWGIVIHGFIDGFCRTVRLHDQLISYSQCNFRSLPYELATTTGRELFSIYSNKPSRSMAYPPVHEVIVVARTSMWQCT